MRECSKGEFKAKFSPLVITNTGILQIWYQQGRIYLLWGTEVDDGEVGYDHKLFCILILLLTMVFTGAPQTHLALKDMIKEVDEDQDKKINLREVSDGNKWDPKHCVTHVIFSFF